jgi:hypothetical protein
VSRYIRNHPVSRLRGAVTSRIEFRHRTKSAGVGRMRKLMRVTAATFVLGAATATLSQETRTTPALELLNTARLADARASEQSFELRATVKLEQESGTEAQGTYLLQWSSPTGWREEFSFSDFRQVRVSAPGGVWEHREPFFLSLRLWELMQALNFYGRFRLPREESLGKLKIHKEGTSELRCLEIARNSSPLDEFCFQKDSAQLVSEHYLPSDRWYKFEDYRTIRSKFFPGHIAVYEGKRLVADFSVSEVRETDGISASLFERPAQAQLRPWCASPVTGGDPLTPIYSGLVQHNGTSTLYGVIGTDGQWHQVYVLASGGASHDEEVLGALKKERWEPSSCNTGPMVVETVFRR